jgi:hypothetical protein
VWASTALIKLTTIDWGQITWQILQWSLNYRVQNFKQIMRTCARTVNVILIDIQWVLCGDVFYVA